MSLDDLAYLTTSQIQRIHNLGGLRNAQRIIKDLSPYLCTTRVDGVAEHVHFLSKKGREWIDSYKERKFTLFIPHFIVRNEFFIHHKIQWKHWYPEQPKLEISKENTLIPDAFCKFDNQWHFLEVDREQRMSQNQQKIELYKMVKENNKFPAKNYGGIFPKIIFITRTPYRHKKLGSLLNKYKLKGEVIMDRDLY